MLKGGEESPKPGVPTLARHPFVTTKRAMVTASKVVPLHQLVWDGQHGGVTSDLPIIDEARHGSRQVRGTVAQELLQIDSAPSFVRDDEHVRPDILQRLNPTPYKVSVSEKLYDFLHSLWEKEAPIRELR